MLNVTHVPKLSLGTSGEISLGTSFFNIFLDDPEGASCLTQRIYYEACLNQTDALRREKYFKTYYGKMFIKKSLNLISQGK